MRQPVAILAVSRADVRLGTGMRYAEFRCKSALMVGVFFTESQNEGTEDEGQSAKDG
jgi:hypothetical protein